MPKKEVDEFRISILNKYIINDISHIIIGYIPFDTLNYRDMIYIAIEYKKDEKYSYKIL